MMDILRFWGKAQPSDPGRGPGWHPLAYHSLDVAAVGEVLLAHDRGFGECISRLLGLPRADADPLIRYLLERAEKQRKAESVPRPRGDEPVPMSSRSRLRSCSPPARG